MNLRLIQVSANTKETCYTLYIQAECFPGNMQNDQAGRANCPVVSGFNDLIHLIQL